MRDKCEAIIYANGIVVKGTHNSRIFVNTNYKKTSGKDGYELVELICARLWDDQLTKMEKKYFHFSRDFFGRTYTVKVITFGREIFEGMCESVAYKNSQTQTFIWDEKIKNKHHERDNI